MKEKIPTPLEMAHQGEVRLKKMADPVRAEQARRYFKEEAYFHGVNAPDLRKLARDLHETVKKVWTLDHALQFCEALLPNRYHEVKGLGILILVRFKRDLPIDFMERLHGWLTCNYLNSWALVDVTCPDLMGALLEKNPTLTEKIKDWAASENRWVRRASLVSFIKLAKKKQFHDCIYQLSALHFSDRDDLIRKANGWLLRETGKMDLKRLERFLLDHGPSIPRTTLRYAIERFEEPQRKAILKITRTLP